ncbi:MAG: hypothetical protein R3E79_36835 [Caldilineaceae bacterium]
MSVLRNLLSGEWQDVPHLYDYRAEWFNKLLVERVTWDATAPVQQIGEKVVVQPNYLWVRFWLLEQEVVLEKYFDQGRQPVGYYLPVCMPVQRRSQQLHALSLYLALWLTPDGRITVLHEDRFDEAAATGELAPVEIEHAEYQIRELTTAIARGAFPPAFVRNFALEEGGIT